MFELNEALRKWRDSLKGKNTLLETDIQELESHLLAEWEILKGKGLSEEEAFWIASRRLGETGELSREFSKVNGNHIWGQRLLWMAMGLLSYLLMKLFIQLVNGIYVASIAAAFNVSGYQLGIFSVVGSVVLLGTALFVCYAIVSKHGISIGKRILKSTGTAKRRTLYLTGFVILIVMLILSNIAVHTIPLRYTGVTSYGRYHAVTAMASLIWSVILPALLAIYVIHNRRRDRMENNT